jgi:hypothetical protein
MSDEQIEKALARIRRARHLGGFPTSEEAQRLATQVERLRYSSGSAETRARALAWCARFLSQGKTISRARELLRKSKEIAATPEAALAQAFITAATDPDKATAALARIRSTAARSAALRIIVNKDGAKKALVWADKSGLTIASFDAEGKFTLMIAALIAGDWSAARRGVDGIRNSDFIECPALLHASAMARLLTAIPNEWRTYAYAQVPFEADTFPLASTPESLSERRAARENFARCSRFALEVGAVDASNLASDYALWLGLRDPDAYDAAIADLRDSMSDPVKSLRPAQFGTQVWLEGGSADD